jgi:hypothetical protein
MISKYFELAGICAGMSGAGIAYALENSLVALPVTPMQSVAGGVVVAIFCFVAALAARNA